VEGQNYLGIYLSENKASVVCLNVRGREHTLLKCFDVSVDPQQEQKFWAVADLIAQGCARQRLEFGNVSVALDCSMFMQHNIHSEFTDAKQIANTIKFDTEEALATDINDVVIAFRTVASDHNGSKLSVFTAQKSILADILTALQNNNIDPITVEPDVQCLERFVSQVLCPPDDPPAETLFAVLSDRNGYLIIPANEQARQPWFARTFLLGQAQNRNALLAGQVPVTIALLDEGQAIKHVKTFDSAGSVDPGCLAEAIAIQTEAVTPGEAVSADLADRADCDNPVDLAIAYGAALAHADKLQTIDFRNDFMPYQGRKVQLRKALKFSSISVIVLLAALGLYAQLQLMQVNNYRKRLHDKFAEQYATVMLGDRFPSKADPLSKLEREKRRIQNVKSGQLSITGEESISSKLTLVLKAFNEYSAGADLNIDSISITTKSISIAGDTSSRRNTLQLFDAIKQGRLRVVQQRLYSKDGRDNFRITAVPAK